MVQHLKGTFPARVGGVMVDEVSDMFTKTGKEVMASKGLEALAKANSELSYKKAKMGTGKIKRKKKMQ